MNVGLRALDVHDAVQGCAVPVHLLYPTRAAARVVAFGPYELEVAPDGDVEAVQRVAAISHGNGGSPWTHRGLAAHLARAGFAVVMVEHPGNSRRDNRLEHTPANLANRPRHLRLALDAALAALPVAPRVGVIGHSIGGYTALAAAGGRPQGVEVEPDPRVAAVALLAPALPWFVGPDALAAVTAPVLARTGERDALCAPAFVAAALRGLPPATPLELQVVPGAGHFSFQSPFPAAMAHLPPAQDPPGFDRAAYQAVLADELERFLVAALAE